MMEDYKQFSKEVDFKISQYSLIVVIVTNYQENYENES